MFVFFYPSQRLPRLSNKSILSLVGDNERACQASNEHRCSWAPQLNAVTSCRHFWGRQKKRRCGLQRPIKNTYSNWPKRNTVRCSFTALPRLHSFASLSDLSQLFSTQTNKVKTKRKRSLSSLLNQSLYRKLQTTHRYTNFLLIFKCLLPFKTPGSRIIYQLCLHTSDDPY